MSDKNDTGEHGDWIERILDDVMASAKSSLPSVEEQKQRVREVFKGYDHTVRNTFRKYLELGLPTGVAAVCTSAFLSASINEEITKLTTQAEVFAAYLNQYIEELAEGSEA